MGVVLFILIILVFAFQENLINFYRTSSYVAENPAPEFKGVTAWLNSDDLTMKSLKGKVVMVDFMTYSCVNCVRTFPHTGKLWELYKDHGFVLIGIQTPEFDFEKDMDNIKVALKKYNITYPVAVDNDMAVWNAFNNHYWPRQYIIDKDSNLVWDHVGEGAYEKMELMIRKLLEEAGATDLPEFKPSDIDEPDFSRALITRETYAGSYRNAGLGSSEVCKEDGTCGYVAPEGKSEGILYPDGEWEQKSGYLEGKGGSLTLPFRAREVNVVLTSPKKVKVVVALDGKPLQKKHAWPDVQFEEDISFIEVDAHDMYRIFKSKDIEEHELTLSPRGRIQVFAYTFG